MKTLITLVLLLFCHSLTGQDFEQVFVAPTPDFKFYITHSKEGYYDSFLKNEYVKLDRTISGQFSKNGTKYDLIIYFEEKEVGFKINSLKLAEPQIAQDGQIYKSFCSEDCVKISTSEQYTILFSNLSNQNYCHLFVLNKQTRYVHEYAIKIELIGKIDQENLILSLDNPDDIHIFKDVEQMKFDEKSGSWGELERVGTSISIKKFSLPQNVTVYQIKKYTFGRSTADLDLLFKYYKQDAVGNYLYECIYGQADSNEQLNKEALASITIQSSEKLSEMAKGQKGALTIIILDGGIFCFFCND